VEQFAVTSETIEGRCRVEACGELDIATVEDLEHAFEAALESAPVELLVDLRAVTFIDSSGVALLLRMIDRCGERPPRFQISPVIARLLEIIGLSERIPLAEPEPGPPPEPLA